MRLKNNIEILNAAYLAIVASRRRITKALIRLWGYAVWYVPLYYTAIRPLYHHVVCNVPVSCKANRDRNQLGAWLDCDPKAD